MNNLDVMILQKFYLKVSLTLKRHIDFASYVEFKYLFLTAYFQKTILIMKTLNTYFITSLTYATHIMLLSTCRTCIHI